MNALLLIARCHIADDETPDLGPNPDVLFTHDHDGHIQRSLHGKPERRPTQTARLKPIDYVALEGDKADKQDKTCIRDVHDDPMVGRGCDPRPIDFD